MHKNMISKTYIHNSNVINAGHTKLDYKFDTPKKNIYSTVCSY